MVRREISGWVIRFWFGTAESDADSWEDAERTARKMVEIFFANLFDPKNTGLMDAPEITRMILKWFSEEDRLAAFEVIDSSGNGIVTYIEWP